MTDSRSGSILAADFGNVHTRVVLIDVVDGVYRLVARGEGITTADFPIADVGVGFNRIIQQISAVTGRKLLDAEGRIITPEKADRSGVDYFTATASAGRPLRTVLIGLVPDVSLASGVRAIAGTYIEVTTTISLADGRSEEERLNTILASSPDLIFITGGTEYGAQDPVLELAEIARLAVLMMERAARPAVLYAGNSQTVPQIREMFDGATSLFIAPNVRPSLENEEVEAAQLQLALAYDRVKGSRGSGFQGVGQMSRLGVLPTAQSYNLVVDYLGKTRAKSGSVLALDIGSATSTLSAAVNGRVTTTIRTDIGLGHSAPNLLEAIDMEALIRWLPFVTTANEIQNYVLNKSARPATIPENIRELYLEHALLKAGIRAMIETARPAWADSALVADDLLPPISLIIGAGAALTQTGHPGLGAMLLLDALQPIGATRLQADSNGLIAALGSLAYLKPEAVVQMLETQSLEHLGTSFSVSGEPRLNRAAMKIKITLDDGEVIQHEVEGGHLWIYPLAPGKQAKVEVSAGGGLSIGGKGRVKMSVEGGLAGLIFDGRGRPLPLAKDARGRAAQLPLWFSEATGQPAHEIDERWLLPTDIDGAAKPAEKQKEPPKAAARPAREKPTRQPRRGKQAAKSEPEAEEENLDDLRSLLS
jgi:uncharacterized protein (TIGR01319 family)